MTLNSKDELLNQQIYARLPDSLYQAFCKYLDKTGQKKTQAIVYAIASYIGYSQADTMELQDIRIDLEDIEGFLENLDRRLAKLERKNKQPITTYRLTDYDKRVISKVAKDYWENNTLITIKDLLEVIGQNPDEQGLQMQVARYLKSQGWEKYRKKINGKHKYIWVKDSE